jgi:hypothetical protein
MKNRLCASNNTTESRATIPTHQTLSESTQQTLSASTQTPTTSTTTTTSPIINIKYLSLPYINTKCDDIARKLSDLVKTSCKDTILRVAFKAPREISNLFPFKDRPDTIQSQSLVVYHIKCLDCEADYIGKTKRIFNLRLDDHETKETALSKHSTSFNPPHRIDHDNLKIIDRASNDTKLVWKEMLHIWKLQPSLNKQMNQELFTFIIPKALKPDDKLRDGENYFTKKYTHNNHK